MSVLTLFGWNVALLIALCVAGEAASRVLGLRFPRLRQADTALWAYDGSKGWFHTPGSSARVYLGGPDNGDVRINALGLRGPRVERRKSPGVRRVLVFGDSFIFGIGVDERHVLTSRLQSKLDVAFPRQYEVINMGVAGYSTDQEYLLFHELGGQLAPDIVILVATDNDFRGNTEDFAYGRYYKPFFELGTDGSLSQRNVPVPRLSSSQGVKLWLAERSNLWNAFRTRRSEYEVVQRWLRHFEVGHPRRAGADSVRLMAALVVAFDRAARASGAAFVAFNTGHRGERTTLFQELRPYLNNQGIVHLGLEGFLGEARLKHPDLKWDFPDDTHWNLDSHRLAAEVIYTHLRREGLWSEKPPLRRAD